MFPAGGPSIFPSKQPDSNPIVLYSFRPPPSSRRRRRRSHSVRNWIRLEKRDSDATTHGIRRQQVAIRRLRTFLLPSARAVIVVFLGRREKCAETGQTKGKESEEVRYARWLAERGRLLQMAFKWVKSFVYAIKEAFVGLASSSSTQNGPHGEICLCLCIYTYKVCFA